MDSVNDISRKSIDIALSSGTVSRQLADILNNIMTQITIIVTYEDRILTSLSTYLQKYFPNIKFNIIQIGKDRDYPSQFSIVTLTDDIVQETEVTLAQVVLNKPVFVLSGSSISKVTLEELEDKFVLGVDPEEVDLSNLSLILNRYYDILTNS